MINLTPCQFLDIKKNKKKNMLLCTTENQLILKSNTMKKKRLSSIENKISLLRDSSKLVVNMTIYRTKIQIFLSEQICNTPSVQTQKDLNRERDRERYASYLLIKNTIRAYQL